MADPFFIVCPMTKSVISRVGLRLEVKLQSRPLRLACPEEHPLFFRLDNFVFWRRFPVGVDQNKDSCPAETKKKCFPGRNKRKCPSGRNKRKCSEGRNKKKCSPGRNTKKCSPCRNKKMCPSGRNKKKSVPQVEKRKCSAGRNAKKCSAGMPSRFPVDLSADRGSSNWTLWLSK